MPTGMLSEVMIVPRGSFVTTAAAAGAASVTVENPTQFDSGGGVVEINGVQYPYTSATEAGVITLTGTLSDPVLEYDPVLVISGGEVFKVYQGWVDLGGGTPVSAEIPYALRAQLPEGQYETPVPVVLSPDLTTVVDLPGRDPKILGSFLDPETLPDQVPTEAPTQSPTIAAYGLPSSIVLRAENTLAATSVLEYHVSTSSFTPTPGDPATLVGSGTRSLVMVVSELPSGALLVDGTTYYFRTIARNDLGDAAPSAEVAAQLDQSAVEAVIARDVIAGFVLAGTIQVGLITLTPGTGVPGDPDYDPGGLNIPLANGGSITLPADGSSAQFIKVLLEATSLLVYDNFELRGAINRIAGTLNLASTVAAPQVGPSVTSPWDDVSIALPISGTSPAYLHSNMYDDGTSWVGLELGATDWGISAINKTTGVKSTIVATLAPGNGIVSDSARGMAKSGSNYYVLWYVASTGAYVVQKYNASWVYQAGGDFTPATVANSRPQDIYADGSTLYITYFRSTDFKSVIRSMTLAGGSQTTVCTTADDRNYAHVAAGSFDFGLGTVFIFYGASGLTSIYNTSGARQTAYEWSIGSVLSLGWDGTFFRATGAGGKLLKLSRNKTSVNRSVRYSQYDNDATGGTHETAWSPAVSFTHQARTWMKVSTSSPQDSGGSDDPNSIRHYVQTASVNASYWRQSTVTASPWAFYYETLLTTGTSAVSTPDFAGVSNPGVLQSAATDGAGPKILLKGDGSGRIGPFSADAAGAVTAIGVCIESRATGAANATSTTNVAVPGVSIAITSTSTNDTWEVHMDADVTVGAAGSQSITELLVDGSPPTSGVQIVVGGPGSPAMRVPGHRCYKVTGLTAGAHTLTMRTRSGGAYNTNCAATHTGLVATRVG